MNVQQLINDCKPQSAITIAAGAAAQTAISSSIIDTKGWKGVLFLLLIGPVVTAGVQSFKIIQSDNADMSSPDDVATSNQAIADSEDNTIRYVDVSTLQKRYLRLVVSRATQDSTFAAVAIPYGARSMPVTQTLTGESINNPVAGTA